jgi:AcrR family transcriptional regulator
VSVPTEEHATRRRRRTPEAAQREIIESAEALLRERPFRELTVDEVMQRTGLSRPSFYVYFKDRHDLVLKVVQHIGAQLLIPSNWWYQGEGDGPMLARKAIGGVVAVYADHGPVLRALADAAADDPDVEHAYTTLVQSFIDQTRKHIEDEIAAGKIEPLDAEQTSTALTWMTERYLYLTLGGDPRTPQETVAETLRTIWIRTLYG